MTQEEEWPADIAYFAFSCAMDADACHTCRQMDGFSFLPEHVRKFSVPIHRCTSVDGCRCQIVGIFYDESGTAEVLVRLKELGGSGTAAQVDAGI